MDFVVTRTGSTLVTLHAGADTTARDDAAAALEETFTALACDAVVDWAVTDTTIAEPPAAPFDPYAVSVSFRLSVTVEAPDATTASRAGADTIDTALEAAELDTVSYASAPTASAA